MLPTEKMRNPAGCRFVGKQGCGAGAAFRTVRGIAVLDGRSRQMRRGAALAAALACALVAAPPAHAGGLLDFLFGGDRASPQPQPPAYAEPAPGLGPIVPAPLAPQSVRQGDVSTGHVVAYCVRLCD